MRAVAETARQQRLCFAGMATLALRGRPRVVLSQEHSAGSIERQELPRLSDRIPRRQTIQDVWIERLQCTDGPSEGDVRWSRQQGRRDGERVGDVSVRSTPDGNERLRWRRGGELRRDEARRWVMAHRQGVREQPGLAHGPPGFPPPRLRLNHRPPRDPYDGAGHRPDS